MIEKYNLTDSVLVEIDVALNAHELIKICIRAADKIVCSKQYLKIKEKLDTEKIHNIGFITVLFRPKIDNKKITL